VQKGVKDSRAYLLEWHALTGYMNHAVSAPRGQLRDGEAFVGCVVNKMTNLTESDSVVGLTHKRAVCPLSTLEVLVPSACIRVS
jgi:hypothetical protein